jgi:hypothetical protein
MNKYMVLFLLGCLVLGLWMPAGKKMGSILVMLTAGLVFFFLLYPNKL